MTIHNHVKDHALHDPSHYYMRIPLAQNHAQERMILRITSIKDINDIHR